jgi:uncharacterized protein YkwD
MEGSKGSFFYCHFHERDEQRTRPSRLSSLAATLIAIFSPFLGALSPWDFSSAGEYPFVAAIAASTLIEFTNADRRENQLGNLRVSAALQEAAQLKADDMAAKGYFAHESPDGHSPWYWFQTAGYDFSYAGENLAVDFSESDDVEKAWMSSLQHRANILSGNFTEIGIATAEGMYEGRQATFVVQEFGAPARRARARSSLRPASAAAPITSHATASTEVATGTQVAFAAVLDPKANDVLAWVDLLRLPQDEAIMFRMRREARR